MAGEFDGSAGTGRQREIPVHPKLGAPSKIWHYLHLDGSTFCSVARFELKGRKEIRQFHLNGAGLEWSRPRGLAPLLNHDRIATLGRVLVVEGEKTADAAQALFPGWAVTTSLGGSSAAGKTDWTAVCGRLVTIWPDADPAGDKYAVSVAELCLQAGAKAVHIVIVPEGAPVGWDLADAPPLASWRLDEMLDAAEEYATPVPAAAAWTDASKVLPKNIDWLWKPRIIKGRINLIVGMGDVGKDTFCCRLIASLTSGAAWPDDEPAPPPHTVGLICPEDEMADTIVPRLLAAGAALSRVRIWNKAAPPTPADVRGLDVLVVSPLITLMDDGKNMNAEQDARSFLQLWQHGGERTVIGTGHLSKKSDLAVVQRILGASGIVNFIRSTWLIQRDSEDASTRLFQRLKNNLTPDDIAGLTFKIEHVGPWDQSIVATITGTTEKLADEVMQASIGAKGKQSAGQWVVECLHRHGGMAQVSVILDEAQKNGLSVDSVKKARERNTKILSVKHGFDKGEWWWQLSNLDQSDLVDGNLSQ